MTSGQNGKIYVLNADNLGGYKQKAWPNRSSSASNNYKPCSVWRIWFVSLEGGFSTRFQLASLSVSPDQMNDYILEADPGRPMPTSLASIRRVSRFLRWLASRLKIRQEELALVFLTVTANGGKLVPAYCG